MSLRAIPEDAEMEESFGKHGYTKQEFSGEELVNVEEDEDLEEDEDMIEFEESFDDEE